LRSAIICVRPALDPIQARNYQRRTGEHTLRRFGTAVWNCDWRQLITLVCLCAFVFVAVAHAGHHIAPLGEKAALSTPAAPSDGGDGDELAATDSDCLFCSLAAAEIAFVDLISRARVNDRVETSVFALTTRPIRAEFPPPIA
jgi:hypothetical protein